MSTADLPPEEQQRLARELAEQLRQLRVEDVLVNTLMTISSIGYRRLGLTEDTKEERDLDQTRLAIETMQALTPVLERFVPGDLVRDFHASVANLQLAYATAATEAGAGPASAAAVEDASPAQAEDMAFERSEDTPEEHASETPENPA